MSRTDDYNLDACRAKGVGVTLQRMMLTSALSSYEHACHMPVCCSPGSPTTPTHNIVIHANELEVDEDGTTSGGIFRTIECARDKGNLFEELVLTECSNGSSGVGMKKSPSLASLMMMHDSSSKHADQAPAGSDGEAYQEAMGGEEQAEDAASMSDEHQQPSTTTGDGHVNVPMTAGEQKACTVYVGDSVSDVLPLIGVSIAGSPSGFWRGAGPVPS